MGKKYKILFLSGWAQNHKSLNILFNRKLDNFEVINLDYLRFLSASSLFDAIKLNNTNPDIVVGWSLGGQIACRLIHEKLINPKYLILLAAPFQFVKSKRISSAMPTKSFNKFRDNFNKNPNITLKKFSTLMNVRNKDHKNLLGDLDVDKNNHQKLSIWLDELESFSCFDLKFTIFPKTYIFHGSCDEVVHLSQSEIFHKKIINSELNIVKNCGHFIHSDNNINLFDLNFI